MKRTYRILLTALLAGTINSLWSFFAFDAVTAEEGYADLHRAVDR